MASFTVSPEAESWVQSSWVGNCCVVASASLVFYDYLTTLEREIELIWSRRLSSVTLLFYLNRWVTIMWIICGLLVSNLVNPEYDSSFMQSLSACAGINIFSSILAIVLLCLWLGFFGIRMYAISSGSWVLTLVTGLLNMVPIATNLYSFFGTVTYNIGDIPGIGAWCLAWQNVTDAAFSNLTIVTRSCVIVADILVIAVTWYKNYGTKREAARHGVKTPLVTMLLWDGTLYFVVLLCLNVVNIAGTVSNVFISVGEFSTPLSSIIISHFILNLRQLAYGRHNNVSDSHLSSTFSQQGPNGSRHRSIRFASFVDNMGEDLDHSAVPTDPDMVWCTVECDTDANDRSDSQAELSQDIIVAWDASGDLPAEAANTEVIHTATNRSLQLQGEFAQDITKGKALSRLQFATPQDAFPTSITSTSKSGRDGLSDV